MTEPVGIEEAQQAIIDEFGQLSDWQDRYRKIIKVGRELEDMPEEHKVDSNLVKGCQNRAWLHARLDGDRVIYMADSEAMIVRGFVALLVRAYSNQTPDDIIATPARFIDELQLGDNISLNRANGLASMVKQIKFYALGFKAILDRQHS